VCPGDDSRNPPSGLEPSTHGIESHFAVFIVPLVVLLHDLSMEPFKMELSTCLLCTEAFVLVGASGTRTVMALECLWLMCSKSCNSQLSQPWTAWQPRSFSALLTRLASYSPCSVRIASQPGTIMWEDSGWRSCVSKGVPSQASTEDCVELCTQDFFFVPGLWRPRCHCWCCWWKRWSWASTGEPRPEAPDAGRLLQRHDAGRALHVQDDHVLSSSCTCTTIQGSLTWLQRVPRLWTCPLVGPGRWCMEHAVYFFISFADGPTPSCNDQDVTLYHF